MNHRYLVLCLLLLHVTFAAEKYECRGYSDSFDVRVLDAKYRPIEGADVWIKYDRGATHGEQYFTTPIKYSDAEGRVPFTIYNQGTASRSIDCDIVISGSSGDAIKRETIVANVHGDTIDIVLDVYRVEFYTRDQWGMPIENTSITVGSITKKTDSNGYTRFLYKKGEYEYLANFLDARQAGSLEIKDDIINNIKFSYYTIGLDVVDDEGNPLTASLNILNQTLQIEDGHFEREKTFGESISYTLSYAGIEKSGEIYPKREPTVTIVFDTHSPIIENIESQRIDNRSRLLITASDPNEFASGIDISSIAVTYKIEPAQATDPWNTAVTFATARNAFTADFPQLPPNSIVQFRINIKDKEGNRASVDGKFSTLKIEIPEEDETQNQTIPQEPEKEEQELPIFYIIGGIIILVLGVYLLNRIKSGGREGM